MPELQSGCGQTKRELGDCRDVENPHQPCNQLTTATAASAKYTAGGGKVAVVAIDLKACELAMTGVIADELFTISDAQLCCITRSEHAKVCSTAEFIQSEIAYFEGLFDLLEQANFDLDDEHNLALSTLTLMGNPTAPINNVMTDENLRLLRTMVSYYYLQRDILNGTVDLQAELQTTTGNPPREASNNPPVDTLMLFFDHFNQDFWKTCGGRSFGVTKAKRLALVPPLCQPCDKIFIPYGAQTPFVVRQTDTQDGITRYVLLGEAFVQGMMSGELIYEFDTGDTIKLV